MTAPAPGLPDPSGPRLRLPTVPYRSFLALIDLIMRPEVILVGADRIPDGPCIATSNHPHREEILLGYRIFTRPVRILLEQGLLDTAYVRNEIEKALQTGYRMPTWSRRFATVAADWLARQNRRLGSIPVARDPDQPGATSINRAAFRASIQALERGEVIGMAPEGQLSPEEGLGKLQRGAAQLAWHFARREEPVPVLPIIFHGIRGLERSLLGRGRIVVALGETLTLEIAPGESRREALDRFTTELHAALTTLDERVNRAWPLESADKSE